MFDLWEKMVDFLVYGVFGLDATTQKAQALHFFIFDTVKIYILLISIIFLIGKLLFSLSSLVFIDLFSVLQQLLHHGYLRFEARHERIEGERGGKAIDKDHRPKGNVFVYYDPIVKKYVSVNRQLDSDINKAIRKSTFNGALEDFYRMSEFPNIEIKEVNL